MSGSNKEDALKNDSEITLTKNEILPLSHGPLPIKGRTRKQDFQDKDKSKNPKVKTQYDQRYGAIDAH